MTTLIRSTTAGLFLLLALAACDDNLVDSNGTPDQSRVSVYLTDAPGDVENVWVDVVEIYLQGDEGRTVLLDEPTGLIELTSLAGETQPLVTDEEIDTGTYGQLRFVIGAAVLETTDGRVYADGADHPGGLDTTGELHCPSCSETGIKVLLGGEEEVEIEEETEDILLDFDVTQSFGRQAGQSGRWVMNPVIHGVKMIEMASIEGTVSVATDEEDEPVTSIPECPAGTARGLEDFVPTATALTLTDDEGGSIVRTGTTDEQGAFRIGGVAPDDYELGYRGEVEFEDATLVWTADVDPASVTVGAGDDVTGVEYTITDAVCEVENGDGNGNGDG